MSFLIDLKKTKCPKQSEKAVRWKNRAFSPATCFRALSTAYLFSRTWHSLHVFPRFATVTCFPARSTGCKFSAFGTGYMFSSAWLPLHVFPRLALVTCFPELGSRCMFSRAWHWLHVFPRLVLVTCFRALSADFAISLRWFPSFALRIPTAHEFCVISARTWARARTKHKRFPSN